MDYGDGASNAKKRKLGQTTPSFQPASARRAQNYTDQSTEQPQRPAVPSFKQPGLLEVPASDVLVRQRPPSEPLFVGSKRLIDYNWYCQTPGGQRDSVNYTAKVARDRESLLALVDTMEHIAAQSGGTLFNLQLSVVTPGQHAKDIGLMAQMLEDQERQKGQQQTTPSAKQPPSRTQVDSNNDPSSKLSFANKNQPVIKAEEPNQGLHTLNLPPVRCANCERHGHELKNCVVPNSEYGSITGCPICNTKRHVLDTCPVLGSKSGPEKNEILVDHLLLARKRAPQIASEKYSWIDLLEVARHRLRPNGLGHIHGELPWTDGFAKKMARTKPYARELGGRTHPDVFRPGRDPREDLPIDTCWIEKTLDQVTDEVKKGKWDRQRKRYRASPSPTEGKKRLWSEGRGEMHTKRWRQY
ncbi:hypothetical protein QBC47DRAFT_431076 [Echria macrotheca]|uniref:Uncharacterized protein n=1 Tax=Echria macrotheca TaxID=438768 RepID=A0AAJ0BA05_9PEZI|nr:hypothetical protein QBC47DRAFT_431076 [Echria macrotheca]